MRKLTTLMLLLLCGCSKHHDTGNPYYFSYQSGSFQYSSTIVDSLFLAKDTTFTGYDAGIISMYSYRDSQMIADAAAGKIDMATFSFYLLNRTSPISAFAGVYTSDTSVSNLKSIQNQSVFRFYTIADPHEGQHFIVPGVPFTITITEYNSSWMAGTFSGQVVGTNKVTQLPDTATITNGKFKVPVTP